MLFLNHIKQIIFMPKEIITLIAILIIPALVLAILTAEPISLTSCTIDSDCTLVQEGCCSCNMGGKTIAINKRYEKEWNENITKNCPQDTVCIALYNCFNYQARCIEKRCEAIK